MKNNQLKSIGTVSINEVENISSFLPWENLVRENIPFSAIGTPEGYLFTQGSACGSLATTSALGWNYIADFYLYRQDGAEIDRDRYLGSITPENDVSVLLVPKQLTPYHHLKIADLPYISLPSIYQGTIEELLKTPQGL